MKAVALGLCLAGMLAAGRSISAGSSGFDRALDKELQAMHVLNRIAFGPRPGDVEHVRRIGIAAWIRRQLRPDTLDEPSLLSGRLQPLGSLRLATWEILETYRPARPIFPTMPARPEPPLSPERMQRLAGGTTEERLAVLAGLSPQNRRRALALVSPQSLQNHPDLQKEAERARQIEEEIRNREFQEVQRRFRPPLSDLLTPEQARDVQRGTDGEKVAVLASLDPDTRTRVFRSLPLQSVPPAYRREALMVMNPQQVVVNELLEGKLFRALYSERQFEEVLVDFWFNHFNVFIGKEPVRMLLTSYERDAIRPHVLGRFHDMLLATARHPAMLYYLDNHQSRAPLREDGLPGIASPGVRVQPGLNENYARELLELHTLGADGGFTQADVVDVARAFTGWTIFNLHQSGEFDFNPGMHDRGGKVVLGHRLPPSGGEQDGVKVLEILARHPSTARHISRRLAQRFVADQPPDALVARMASTFTETDGDLRAVMETLLFSREFLSEGAWQAKIKSPFEIAVSALRVLDAEVSDATALAERVASLGQPLYGRSSPDGYPNTAETWVSSAALLARLNFATALLAGEIPGIVVDPGEIPSQDLRGAFLRFVGVTPDESLLDTLRAGLERWPPDPPMLATLLLASPAFQRR